jgi:hypothetical protein
MLRNDQVIIDLNIKIVRVYITKNSCKLVAQEQYEIMKMTHTEYCMYCVDPVPNEKKYEIRSISHVANGFAGTTNCMQCYVARSLDSSRMASCHRQVLVGLVLSSMHGYLAKRGQV